MWRNIANLEFFYIYIFRLLYRYHIFFFFIKYILSYCVFFVITKLFHNLFPNIKMNLILMNIFFNVHLFLFNQIMFQIIRHFYVLLIQCQNPTFLLIIDIIKIRYEIDYIHVTINSLKYTKVILIRKRIS